MRVSLSVPAAILSLAACTTPQTTLAARDIPSPAAAKPAVSRDVSCLAEAVYFEARGTSETAQEAVAHVVVNRAEAPEFPDTVCGVVADGCQFSYRCDGRADVLAEPRDRADALGIARRVLTGARDITQGALFFHSDDVSPGWFNTRPRVGEFGGNVFYR